MKRVELIIAAILVPLDYAMLLLAGWLAYAIRFGDTIVGIRAIIYALPLQDYMIVLAATSVVMIAIFALNGLYDTTGTRRIIDEIKKVFLACSTGVLVVIVLFFFNRELFSSRFIIITGWILSIILVTVMRIVVIYIERAMFRRGIGTHRVLLIGDSRSAKILNEVMTDHPVFGFQVVERASTIDDHFFDKLAKIIQIKQIDEVIAADQALPRDTIARLIEFCKNHHLDFKFAADIFDANISHISMRPIAGIPLVELRRTALQGWGRIFKRLFDFLFSLLAIIIFGPIMILTALAVKLDSPGPVIYRNRRVGEDGKEFDTFKFRSMKQEYCIGDQFDHTTEALKIEEQLIKEQSIKEGPLYKIKDDPRVTRIGHFIRRTSLDEFPQFFNVLLGQMSIVGPRPHQPREVAKYASHHKAILSMRPGITGLAQISGRSDLSFEEEIRLDSYYMENWTLLLDFYIVFKTPFILLRKRVAL